LGRALSESPILVDHLCYPKRHARDRSVRGP
jgi:hypothetical protein